MSDEVAQIKARIDIVDFISSYLSLKRAGRNFVACCPFHQEKSPSFNVSPDRQSFHCFGCQKGGDLFTFLMDYENLSFREALEKLAPQAGVTLQNNPNHQRDRGQEKRWTKILNCAGHFFYQHFNSDSGKEAKEYLKKRGFHDELIERYKIGYAPNSWDAFIQHAQNKGHRLQDLVTMGLAKQGPSGKYFDFFRHRVMFPVRNAQGQVVAFGGRVLDGSEPKYLNSPETPLFNKSKTLFNFTFAREMVREHGHFLMMEGYTDVMMAVQFGLGPAVATLGTAMTEDHVRMLKRFDVPLFLVYDGDRAGRNAMERALPFVLKLGLEAKAITLPDGQDPADFLLQHEDWTTRWQSLKDESLDIFDYKLVTLIKEKGDDTPELKISIAKIMLEDLKLNRDPIRKAVYLETMAQRLGVHRRDLEEQLSLVEKKHGEEVQIKIPSSNINKDAAFYLLAITLIEKNDFITPLEELSNLPFLSSESSKVLELWLKAHAQPGSISHDAFLENLSEAQQEIFREARITELPLDPDELRETFEENLKKWTDDKHKLEAIKAQIKQAETSGDQEALMRLLKAKSDILRQSKKSHDSGLGSP